MLRRNRLLSKDGDEYSAAEPWTRESYLGGHRNVQNIIVGDLRRIERDQRDEQHLAWYAQQTGLTPEQVKSVLDLLFDYDSWGGKR